MKHFSLKKAACFVTAAAMLFVMAGCQLGKKVEINLADYIKYEFTGYNGDGVLTYEFDYKDLMDDLEENKIKFDKSDVKDTVKLTPDKTEKLSNGDTVTFDIDIKNRLENNVKATFIYEAFEVTVDGLEDRPVFDPFAYVKVIYTGVGPDAVATLEMDGNSPVRGIRYKITSENRGRKLKNGDKITVTASVSSSKGIEKVCADAGYTLAAETKEYTVEGLDEYATSINQITPKMIEDLTKQATDTFNSSIGSWASDSKLNKCEYAGLYFLTVKDGVNNSKKNIVFTILHINCTTAAGEFDYYFYVAFNNVVVKSDGTNEIYRITDVQYPRGSEYSNNAIKKGSGSNRRYVIGYTDVEALYNDAIRKNSQYYNIENNITGASQTTETTTSETSAETSASETQTTETT